MDRDALSVSIRAPRTCAGRLIADSPERAPANVSIRAPRTRAGRRVRGCHHSRQQVVSIRAPRTRAGRLTVITGRPRLNLFQSAPRARARGDIVSFAVAL